MIEIQIKPNKSFDGNTTKEVINDIAKHYIEADDFNQEIQSITEFFDNGFSRAFYQSEIDKVQKDLDVKLNEAEQEHYDQLEEEDWREQESIEYLENR